MLRILLSLFLIWVSTGFTKSQAQGLDNCPYPPFSAMETGKPNILIVLDHSGSMNVVPEGSSKSRWNTARQVAKEIIDDFPNVRFGLLRMDGGDSSGNDNLSIESPYIRQGGKLLKPVGTPGDEIKAYIDDWGPTSNKPQTWTTLAETLAGAGLYFATAEVAGIHTGEDDSPILTDSNVHFQNDGIRSGDIIFNTTDDSYGTITAVTPTTIAANLTGGTDNHWDHNDGYTSAKNSGRGPSGLGAYYKPYHPNHLDSKCHYVTGKLAPGKKPWIDQNHTINSQPAEFTNYVAIRTYQDKFSDKMNTDAALMDLKLPVSATVHVAYQNGKKLPTWLEAYTQTTKTVTTSNGITFRIYEKNFDGGIVTLGGNRHGSGNGEYTYFAYVSLPGGINDCIASNADDRGRYVNATSPIENECQQSSIIFITDGLANNDSDWTMVRDVIGDYDNDGTDPNQGYLDDVAMYLFKNDMRSDLPGTQNLTTYLVGYNQNDPLLLNAAVKGGGLYFSANNASTITASLRQIITANLDRISAGTAVSTITTSSESEDYLIRAKCLPVSWKGFLEGFTLPYVEGEAPRWEAGAVLAERIEVHGAADRQIFTYMDSEPRGKQDFAATNSALVDTLKLEWQETSDSEVRDKIDFIRGDDSFEGGKYRDRKGWYLGDIIYSAPIVVGPPRSFHLENGYQRFKNQYLTRETMIYVGANDGMLHAFSASDGSEAWGFIPEKIRSNLIHLTLESCHRYYVDLSATVGDVWDLAWQTAGKDWTGWRTVLLGGNRLGGEEYFTLDITNPAADAVSVLWDKIVFAGRKSSTVPFVAKVKGGQVDKWVAIITSGYDEDGARTGRIAAVNLTDGDKESIWQEDNSIVNELETQGKSGASLYYSLTSPVGVDADNDGYLDLIYAGDTEGSIWKFHYDYNDAIWKRSELFNSGGQPITARPALAFDAQQNLRIYFGSGKYLVGKDKENTLRNTYYCIIEKKYQAQRPNDPNQGHFTNVEAKPLGPSDLADVTSFSSRSYFNDYVGNLTEADQDAFQGKYARGWYFHLDDPGGQPGERVVHESAVVDGVVFFTSFSPNEDICGDGGEARLYAVDYITGTIATSGGSTALAAEGGGNIKERYRTLGPGFPSKPAYHRDMGTGQSRVLVHTNDATVYAEKVNLAGKLWEIRSWRYVD